MIRSCKGVRQIVKLLMLTSEENIAKDYSVSQTNVSQPEKAGQKLDQKAEHKVVLEKLLDLYAEMFSHDGYGDVRVEFKILRRGQKEVILHCGKQYRYVLNCDQALSDQSPIKALLKRDLLA